MKGDNQRDDWGRRLRPFDAVWNRVQSAGHRPPPPGPPGPPPGPPGPPPPPPFAPPPPPPPPCGKRCTRAVRFNPHGGRR